MCLQTLHLGKDTLVPLISLPAVETMNGAPVISWRAIVYVYSKVMSYFNLRNCIYATEFMLLDFELLNLRS